MEDETSSCSSDSNEDDEWGEEEKIVFICMFILIFFVLMSGFGYLVHGAGPPCLYSNLHSFSITPSPSPSNNDGDGDGDGDGDDSSASFSTAHCHVLLSLGKDKAKYLNMDTAKASMSYRGEKFWINVIDPFGLPQREPINVPINLTATLLDWVAADLEYQRRRRLELEFDYKLEGIGSLASGRAGPRYGEIVEWEGALLEVRCGGLQAAFLPIPALSNGDAPIKCHGEIDDHLC